VRVSTKVAAAILAVGLVSCLLPHHAAAQAPPGFDIYLFPFHVLADTIELGEPVNITARPGYDNQPSFTPDGASILYTSIREDSAADVYRYSIRDRKTVRVTQTPESEFSPTVMPGDSTISVVRVEADSTQRLWSFALDGSRPRLLLENVKPVGYHAWIDERRLALFILGEPHTLQRADLATGRADTVALDIGRALHRIPESTSISFVHKRGENDWWITEMNPETKTLTALAPTLEGVEDLGWTPDGRLIACRDQVLHIWRAADATAPGKWLPAGRLVLPDSATVSRIAVSPDGEWLAVVAQETTRN
jgi:WD40 repeat protein